MARAGGSGAATTRRVAGAREAVLDWAPLVGLVLFGVVAVAGYGVFGRDPSRLAGVSDWAVGFYGRSFGFFSQGHVLLAGVVLGLHLTRHARWRWLGALVLVYGVSLGSELLGTAYGVPFGPYEYTSLLGPKVAGLVPWLIPLSWFSMAIPSYGLASRALERPGGRALRSGGVSWLWRIGLGSLLLLGWDLALDPAMSEATPYWVWGERGPYYGMPLMNLFGWYVTGLVLMGVLEWRGARSWLGSVSSRWLAVYYGANLVVPLGMVVVSGMWGAAVATVALLACVWAVRQLHGALLVAAGRGEVAA
jgi:uncharacterized membrane protein